MRCYRCGNELDNSEFECSACGARRLWEVSDEVGLVYVQLVHDLYAVQFFLEYQYEREAKRLKEGEEPVWGSVNEWGREIHKVQWLLSEALGLNILPYEKSEYTYVVAMLEWMKEYTGNVYGALISTEVEWEEKKFEERLPKMKFYLGDIHVLKRSVHWWDKECVEKDKKVLATCSEVESVYLASLEYLAQAWWIER